MEYERDMKNLTRIMEQRKESLERAKAEDESTDPVSGGAFDDRAYLAMIN